MTQTLEQVEEQQSQRAITTRRYEPLAPIGSAGGLKALLDAQRQSLAVALPKHITPERLIKTMLVAANRTPGLLACTQASILETINRAAELGLDLSGTLGEAYPVPFKNRVKTADGREAWVDQCQLIIGYRGYEKLAWQSDQVASIDAEVVRENDSFLFKKGTEILLEWCPKLDGDRGKPIGAYACVVMKSGGKIARFLTVGDIETIRNSAKSKDSPAWRNWWEEMARKCAIKRVMKDAPLSTEKMAKAMEIDNEDHDLVDVLSVEPTRPPEGRHSFASFGNRKRQQLERQPETTEDAAATGEGVTPGDEGGSQDGAANETPPEEDAQPREPQGAQAEPAADSQIGDEVMPDPCPKAWIVDLMRRQAPTDMEAADVDKRIEQYFKIGLPKPWEKHTRAFHEAFARDLLAGNFKWRNGNGTK